MPAFLFRLSALAVRFLCPLVALALSSPETMGKYYLFISYFTFVVGVSALELAVPFSRKYLRCRGDKQRRLVFAGFMTNQMVVTTALAIPSGILVASWAGVPAMLIPMFCLSLATEACVNEVGRFFWNIGEWRMPSLRDLIRACIFTLAIIGSVYLEDEVLTAVTFTTITVGNICIMAWEWKVWGSSSLHAQLRPAHLLKGVQLRVRRSLVGSLPHFAHMQLLGLQPLLERTLLDKSMGLATVAAFSFLTSVMQSAAGLMLVPMIAQMRKKLLGSRTVLERMEANRGAFTLLAKISIISGTLSLALYWTMPEILKLIEKNISADFSLTLAALLSSISAIFCSAISPLLTTRDRAWTFNAVTLLSFLPLGFAQLSELNSTTTLLAISVICGVAVLQLVIRVILIHRQIKFLTYL